MFLINKEDELTNDKLGVILQQFQTKDLITLNNYYNYYKGNQKIMNKTPSDVGKPCNRVVTNYCFNITNNYQGYLLGRDISYSSNDNFDSIQEVLNYNDVHCQDNELLKNALIFGVGYEIAYLDENGKNRFKVLDPRTVVPVYDTSLEQNLIYAIRFYMNDTVSRDEYIVEVYNDKEIITYKSSVGFASFIEIDRKPHYFGQVPICVFNLNTDNESIFSQIMTLQDSYNELLSDEVDDFEAFADAYLVLKGVQADGEDLVSMKQNKVLMVDEDSSVEYLTKNISDTQIQNMLKDINDSIHKIANSPDFSQESFGVASGVALRFRLLGFENTASGIEANMRKAIQKRIELICEILSLKGEDVWRDIQIQFTRNLPVNVEETANMVNTLRGLVSDKTLLSLLPFITDPQAELELLQEQQEKNISMYSFPSGEEVNE